MPIGLSSSHVIRTKLALSHALAQSVKISLFEELIGSTIDQTKDIPKSMSETGKIGVTLSSPSCCFGEADENGSCLGRRS